MPLFFHVAILFLPIVSAFIPTLSKLIDEVISITGFPKLAVY